MRDLQEVDGPAQVENEIHAYRTRRQRSRAQLRKEKNYRLSPDAADIVRCARIWAAFGGPPADEIFVRFGMSEARFAERLWQILGDVSSHPEMDESDRKCLSAAAIVRCSPRGDATRPRTSSDDPAIKEGR
jgi:hypothetical protein